VLVLRDAADGPEVFMVRRHEGVGSFRGAHVFPGGRVDERDLANESWADGVERATRQLPSLSDDEAIGYFVAAARELFEEAGVLLARDRSGQYVSLHGSSDRERFSQYRQDVHGHRLSFGEVFEREGLRLALDALTLYAHWVTPPVEGKRFDTRFFVARLPPGQTPAHDETETTESCWITAGAAIRAGDERQMQIPPPTWVTLREIGPFRSVGEIVAAALTRTVVRREPRLVHEGDTRVLLMPDDRTRFVWFDGYWRPERIER
jgi:8-oxo-dGTP pyrophosphatase MutT (NUDIX family)